MKKLLFLLFCFALFHGKVMASEEGLLSLNIKVEKIDESPGMFGHSKTVVHTPRVYQDGYKLTFSRFHPEFVIDIIKNDELVFSSVIPAGMTEFELPSYIDGECIIQIKNERFCFWGYISL